MPIYERKHRNGMSGGKVEFVHPELCSEIEAIGGHYLFSREEGLDHPSGKILYLVGYAVTDRACCGPMGCSYAVVPGRIVSLRDRLNSENRYVSIVDPIDEKLYEELASAIRMKEGVSQVHFLCEKGGTRVMF